MSKTSKLKQNELFPECFIQSIIKSINDGIFKKFLPFPESFVSEDPLKIENPKCTVVKVKINRKFFIPGYMRARVVVLLRAKK